MSDVPGKFFIGQIRRSGTSGSSPGFLIGEADPPDPVNPDGTGVGVNRFTQLVDTPESYTGQNGKFIKVNSSENALEFGDFPEWSERENNTVLFDKNYIIGNAAARTGNILFDFTGAKLGAETEMRHADASAFTFPSEAMLMFDTSDISTTDDNYFLFVLTDKTASSEVVKVFHALEGGL